MFTKIELIGIILLILALFIGVINLFLYFLYKKMVQNIFESSIIVENIARYPILLKLERIEFLKNKNPQKYQHNFTIWKLEYINIFKKELVLIYQELQLFLDDKNKMWPTKKNFQSTKHILEKTEQLFYNLRQMDHDMDFYFDEETLLRDQAIDLRIIFNEVFDQIRVESKDADFPFDQALINNYKEDWNNKLNLIDEIIIHGEFQKAKEAFDKLINIIARLAIKYKAGQQIAYTVFTKLPQILEALDGQVKQMIQAEVISKIELQTIKKFQVEYVLFAKEIKTSLLSLHSEKAAKILGDFQSKINAYRWSIMSDSKLNKFFRNDIDDIQNIFTKLEQEVEEIYGLINFNAKMEKDISKVMIEYKEISNSIATNAKTFKSLKNQIENNVYELDKVELSNKVLNLLISTKEIINKFKQIYVQLSSKNIYIIDFEQSIFDIRKQLSKIEIMVSKNPYIQSALPSTIKLNKLFVLIDEAEQEKDNIGATEYNLDKNKYDQIKQKLDAFKEEVMLLENDVFNEILIQQTLTEAIAFAIMLSGNAVINKDEFEERITNIVELLNIQTISVEDTQIKLLQIISLIKEI